jgi:Putative auto-transporter adhesin, head GIN domain
MKKVFGVLALCFILFSALAQESEVRSVGSFTGVKVGEAIDVYLKKGDKESVKVEVTGARVSNVLTEVSGSYLKIHMQDGRYKNRNVKVYVTYVSLEKIHASSASNVFSEGTIRANSMDISASSAASVEITIETGFASVDASSAGDLVLEGKARELALEVSSAGEVDAYALESEIVRANASSAGSAKISVSKELNAHASSGGSIRFRGSPAKTNTDSSSGGSVKKSN